MNHTAPIDLTFLASCRGVTYKTAPVFKYHANAEVGLSSRPIQRSLPASEENGDLLTRLPNTARNSTMASASLTYLSHGQVRHMHRVERPLALTTLDAMFHLLRVGLKPLTRNVSVGKRACRASTTGSVRCCRREPVLASRRALRPQSHFQQLPRDGRRGDDSGSATMWFYWVWYW